DSEQPCVARSTRRRAPRSTLFPYTPLFRSDWSFGSTVAAQVGYFFGRTRDEIVWDAGIGPWGGYTQYGRTRKSGVELALQLRPRSEEHTSELQSRENLVCRLLLEKKKLQST